MTHHATDLTCLDIQGPDAEKFLQGQLSCDVTKCDGGLRLGCHCTPAGRVIMSFLITRLSGEHFRLLLPASVFTKAQESLAKYAIFSKVELARVETPVCLVAGAGHYALDETHGLSVDVSPATEDLTPWQAYSVAREWVWIQAETSEQFTPQMIGLVETGAVDFKKGCYTGQEIIARTHYRGKAKQTLQSLTASERPTLGAPLTDDAGKTIGTIVGFAPQTDGSYRVLASVKLAQKT